MGYTAALELTALVALSLIAVHLLTPRFRSWADGRATVVAPIGGGALAAYIFLHLLPALGEDEVDYGMAVTLVVLIGFVTYYGLESYVAEHAHKLFRVKLAIGWVYSFVIIYSLPGTIEESVVAALISAVALGLHVLQSDHHLAEERPESFDRWGRYVLATAPLTAVGLDVVLGAPPTQSAALLSAFASGMLLLGLFRDGIGHRRHLSEFPWFLLGLSLYGGLLLMERVIG